MNGYVYVSNNPTNFTDPDGLDIDNTRGKTKVYYKEEDSEQVNSVAPGSYLAGYHDGIVEPSTGDVYQTHGKHGIQDDVWFDENGCVQDMYDEEPRDADFRKKHQDWEPLFQKGDEIKRNLNLSK